MRLHPHLIRYIAESMVADLQREQQIRIGDDRLLTDRIERIFTAEFRKEEALDDEVREILSEHYEELRRSGLSYDDLFKQAKKRLAKQKGIVL